MKELSLHILDITENSISAKAKQINIDVIENANLDLLKISIKDDGNGMDTNMLATVVDPFVTSRTTRKVGLGIPLLKAAAESCNGSFSIQSQVGVGTQLDVVFQYSHIDRMPLGDLSSTMLQMVVSNPQIHWIFKYQYNEHVFFFDDEPIKNELADISLTEPIILNFLRDLFETGISEARSEI
ncbi:MAG: ATP-binding protein [Chloroflexi bacterium]|nr:ATP-binding protein [Chloroflexota bacterium]